MRLLRFSQATSDSVTAQSPKLCQGRFSLEIRKNLFTERALRHRDRWPGRCWGPVPGKGRLDVALVDTAVFGRRRDSMTPETFPSLAEPGSGPAPPGTPRPPAPPGAWRGEAGPAPAFPGRGGAARGAGADVAGGSGGRSAPVYCSRRRRRLLPFPAPAGSRREGGREGRRTAGPSEQSPSAGGGGGRGRRGRAGGGAARGR